MYSFALFYVKDIETLNLIKFGSESFNSKPNLKSNF